MNNLLVTTDWLADHLNDANLRVVDIRGHALPASEPPPHYFSHRDDYQQSHIPGAVFVEWHTEIVEPGSRSYDVANPQRYTALMGSLGIGDDSVVVAYDDANGMFAACLWWTLQYYGHSQTAVLDGGWQKWLAEGRPVTNEQPEINAATFTPAIDTRLNTTADEIVAQQPILIDSRSKAEFDGESSRARRMGHIPGAINVPRSDLVTGAGNLRPVGELRQIFADAGIPLDDSNLVVYCNSGVSASYTLIALRAAGLKGGRVYDGSWKDWGNDDTRPIE